MSGSESISERELIILRSISKAADLHGLSKLTNLPPAAVGREVATLQLRGYIADDGTLTKKGLEAIQS